MRPVSRVSDGCWADGLSRPFPDLTEPEPMLQLRNIHASYGVIEVLRGIDLSVPAGGVLALIGPNSAGKTTALRIIAGCIP